MKKFNNLSKKVNISLAIIFVLTSVVSMYFSNALAGKGDQLKELENNIEELTKENEYLKAQYYSMSSLNTINEKAMADGFAKAKVDFYNPPELASSR